MCTISGGLVKVNLSPGQKQMQDGLMPEVEMENEQYCGHSVSNKWHGIGSNEADQMRLCRYFYNKYALRKGLFVLEKWQ